MNKQQTSQFISEQLKLFLAKGGVITVGKTHKQNKSNTSFSLTRNTVAHRGRKSINLASRGIGSKHFA